MKYIGPYFRMYSLSKDNIKNQLFFFARESLKTIVLESKCGIELNDKGFSNKNSPKDNVINSKYNPILSIYKRSSPELIHNKSTISFDASSFKRELNPSANALMTMCISQLSNYYSYYEKNNRSDTSLKTTYISLAQKQLDFYYDNLRNDEGYFVSKKNNSDKIFSKDSLITTDKKTSLSDQSFMMLAYYLFSLNCENNTTSPNISEEYKNFSFEILNMFIEYKNQLYNLSFDENIKILFCLIVFYNYSHKNECINIIIDLCDYLIDKFESKNYYESALDNVCLFALCLKDCYLITQIDIFKEKQCEIIKELKNMYDEDTHTLIKSNNKKDKKEIKYSCSEIILYLLVMLILDDSNVTNHTYSNMISNYYKKMFISSGIVCSFPDAPTLDEVERYKKLSLVAQDMLDEINFRMPRASNSKINCLAPVLIKSVVYSKKKDVFNTKHRIFDSKRNLFLIYLIIYYFTDNAKELMNFC